MTTVLNREDKLWSQRNTSNIISFLINFMFIERFNELLTYNNVTGRVKAHITSIIQLT